MVAVADVDGEPHGAAITGQSNTRWYLESDPNDRAAMGVAFLNGQQMPTVESAETDFSTLGTQMRAFSDWGVGMEETVASVMSDGA